MNKRQNRKKLGLCYSCNRPILRGVLCEYHINYSKINGRKLYLDLKRKVFDHYGNKCTCCDEDVLQFLSIDHVNNDGNKQRRSVATNGITRGGYTRAILKSIVDNEFPSSYRLLCHNCNLGRAINGGKCPAINHKGVS